MSATLNGVTRTSPPPCFLLSALAHNAHLQQMGIALYEQQMLGTYLTGAVDHWRSPVMKALRGSALAGALQADRRLSRRTVPDIPEELIVSTWRWELLGQLGRFVPHTELMGDWVWEQGELSADRRAARVLEQPQYTALISVEHQALASLQAARQLGKPGFLIFTSAHHKTYEKWVAPEFERCGQLRLPWEDTLAERSRWRNARRDEEMEVADYILCNSRFTGQSLVEGGADPRKIISVPLGCPATSSLPFRESTGTTRFLFSGRVSVGKGAHYLFDAWRKFAPGRRDVELHLCGGVHLPESLLEGLPSSVHLHGNLSSDELQQQYDAADYLVFPTLSDGFGLVVGEALSRGLPVITTTNAGAADLVRSEENGLVIEPRSTEALVAALEWGLASRPRLPELRRAAWQTAHNWSWADFRQAIVQQLHNKVPALTHSAVS